MSRLAPDWHLQSACQYEDPSLWFAPDVETVGARRAREDKARAVCAACPVKRPCLQGAMATGQRNGIWGGADFSAHHGPLCKNRIHLMDSANAWLDASGSLVCLACRTATEERRARREGWAA